MFCKLNGKSKMISTLLENRITRNAIQALENVRANEGWLFKDIQ